ncbi:DEAD/DEAH box helicase [Edaphobacter sp.]|uniref:DEAD/DEAH box helicase n=1 Tax=Edaphobacter sp. TaxID=1934404 RepID=UPI0039C85EAF
MDVFDLDRALLQDYERFARSFTKIRAHDIREQVDRVYAFGRFWTVPLISINLHFQNGAALSKLVVEGTLHPETERIFRIDGKPITLFRHQSQAITRAAPQQSFAVTTCTDSGKSLCFFIPIIDWAIRACVGGKPSRTRAIVVCSMNALANCRWQNSRSSSTRLTCRKG